MSDFTADNMDTLNFRDVLARIDRQQAETRKFVAERDKLLAEADKLRRDRSLAPILAAAALGGLIATVGGFAATLIPIVARSWGVH